MTHYEHSDIIIRAGDGAPAREVAPGVPGRKEIEMAKVIRTYELMPTDGHKSFYKKAVVRIYDDGTEVLHSYGTDVITRKADGALVRHWDGWSATTGRHVAAFCGINKKAWDKMPVVDNRGEYSYIATLIPDRIHL